MKQFKGYLVVLLVGFAREISRRGSVVKGGMCGTRGARNERERENGLRVRVARKWGDGVRVLKAWSGG